MTVDLTTLAWGTVQDREGVALEGNAFTVTDESGTDVLTGETDANGQIVGELPTGRYTLAVEDATDKTVDVPVTTTTGRVYADPDDLQGAVDALPANGGTIVLPPGLITTGTQLNADGKRSVMFEGAGGMSAGLGTGTVIEYTGTLSPFISADSSEGFGLRDVFVNYSNAGFNGTLIDLSASKYAAIERSQLAGAGIRTAAQLVLLNNAQSLSMEKCVLQNAVRGIRGRLTGADFSNAHRFSSVHFVQGTITTALIADLGQGCVIEASALEALVGDIPGAYKQTVGAADGLVIMGCWIGDAAADGTWIDLGSNGGGGIQIIGNEIDGWDNGGTPTGTAVSIGGSARGVVVTANNFAHLATPVAWGTTALWGVQSGNNYQNCTNVYTGAPLSGVTEHKSGDGGMELRGATSVTGTWRHMGTQLGFYGHALQSQQVLATGAGHTVDDVITALQTVGLVKQS